MTHVSNFKAATALVWTLVAVFFVGVFLYANYSGIASYTGLKKTAPAEVSHDSLDTMLW